MIEQFFTQPKVLSRLQEGFFGPYLPAFAASLHEEGYSAGCIRRHLRAADHFGAWFTEQEADCWRFKLSDPGTLHRRTRTVVFCLQTQRQIAAQRSGSA